MDMDSIVEKMKRELAKAEERKTALAKDMQEAEDRVARLNTALEEIGKLSTPRAPAAPRPVRRFRGRITAKDAIYRALVANGEQGAKVAVLRDRAAQEYGRKITPTAASKALWTLGKEGRIRREGFLWFVVDAGQAPLIAAEETAAAPAAQAESPSSESAPGGVPATGTEGLT